MLCLQTIITLRIQISTNFIFLQINIIIFHHNYKFFIVSIFSFVKTIVYCLKCSTILFIVLYTSLCSDLFLHHLSRLKPEHKHMKAFKKILKECYDKAVKDTKNLYKKLNQDLSSLEEKQNKLVDMYIEGKIRENDYKLKSESYSNEVNNIKNTLSTMESPKDDFNKCVDFVCKSLEHIDKVWLQSDLDTKQRLQKLIFPEGLIYENNGFRTGSNTCLFTKKGALMAPDFNMVLPRGFEPLPHP